MKLVYLRRASIDDKYVHCYVNTLGYFYVLEEELTPEQLENNLPYDILASGDNLDKAIDKAIRIVKQSKRQRVSVPFITAEGKRGIARGFHARTGELLVWIDDGSEKGRNDAFSSYRSTYVRPPLALHPNTSTKDFEKYLRLLKQREKAHEIWKRADEIVKKWEDQHRYDIYAATQAEITKHYHEKEQP